MLCILLENGNGRTQREFIQIVAKLNGIDIDFTSVDEETMIIASHDSINGNYNKFLEMFTKCSSPISKEEQLESVETYILSNELKNDLLILLK